MGFNSHKPIVIGIVGHIPAEDLSDFRAYLEAYPNFRMIRFQESDNKLWIVSRDGDPNAY